MAMSMPWGPVVPPVMWIRIVPSRDDRWIYFTLQAAEADVWLMSRE